MREIVINDPSIHPRTIVDSVSSLRPSSVTTTSRNGQITREIIHEDGHSEFQVLEEPLSTSTSTNSSNNNNNNNDGPITGTRMTARTRTSTRSSGSQPDYSHIVETVKNIYHDMSIETNAAQERLVTQLLGTTEERQGKREREERELELFESELKRRKDRDDALVAEQKRFNDLFEKFLSSRSDNTPNNLHTHIFLNKHLLYYLLNILP